MKHNGVLLKSVALPAISVSKALVITAENKYLKITIAVFLRTTPVSVAISLRTSNGSVIRLNVPTYADIKTVFPTEGLANFNPLQGHTIRKGLARRPKLCVHEWKEGERIKLTRPPLFTKTTPVLPLFITVAMLCSIGPLYSVR
jgi:hypothetical protein